MYVHTYLAAGAVVKLRGGCPKGYVSSTTKSFLPLTYCYQLLPEKMNYQTAKYFCQKQRSILLEFDTRAEVRFIILHNLHPIGAEIERTIYTYLPLG